MHKIASLVERIWTWLTVSSADPTKVSLTVKGVLGATAATLIGLLGAVHYSIPGMPDLLNTITDNIVVIVQYGLGIVSAVSIVIGAIRKIIYTVAGAHPAQQ